MTSISDTIRGKQFRLALRGYAVEEVDAFLDQLEALARETGPVAADRPAPEPGDGGATALRTLRHAELTADRMLDEAGTEAAAVLAAAREQAEELLTVAREDAARCRDEAALQQRKAVQVLERRHSELSAETERLAELEQAHREQLEALLTEQLRQVARPALPQPQSAAA